MIELKEILNKTGWTVAKWNNLQRAGLIPKPKKIRKQKGGVYGVYEPAIMDLIARIKEEQDNGLSYAEIKKSFRIWAGDVFGVAYTKIERFFPEARTGYDDLFEQQEYCIKENPYLIKMEIEKCAMVKVHERILQIISNLLSINLMLNTEIDRAKTEQERESFKMLKAIKNDEYWGLKKRQLLLTEALIKNETLDEVDRDLSHFVKAAM